MPESKWINFIREFAKEKKTSYGCALSGYTEELKKAYVLFKEGKNWKEPHKQPNDELERTKYILDKKLELTKRKHSKFFSPETNEELFARMEGFESKPRDKREIKREAKKLIRGTMTKKEEKELDKAIEQSKKERETKEEMFINTLTPEEKEIYLAPTPSFKPIYKKKRGVLL
jgi:hypothetical protein